MRIDDEKRKEEERNFRESEPFEDIMEALSSESDGSDLVEVGVPKGIDLEDCNKELAKLIQMKKA